MRKSGSYEAFFYEVMSQFEQEFHAHADEGIGSVDDLKRVERLFSMSDEDAAKELSRCASRAGQKVRSKSIYLSDDVLKK